jgi:hypothetical protein
MSMLNHFSLFQYADDAEFLYSWNLRKIFANSFEFIADSKRRCMLVAAPLISPSSYDEYALQEIRTCLTSKRSRKSLTFCSWRCSGKWNDWPNRLRFVNCTNQFSVNLL